MLKRRFSAVIIGIMVIGGLTAQQPRLKVKITDKEDVTTIVENISSSSSSSCNTSDFPVYQGTTKTDMNFRDLKKVVVRHDKPAEDATNYLSVELISNEGESGIYEMIKSIRIIGKSEEGNFSIKVIDVKTVEVLN